MVKYVHVVKAHALQAGVQTGHQVFAGAPVTVRTGPAVITGLGGNKQLVSVGSQIGCQNGSKIFLRLSSGRSAVIICKVKMCYAIIKCRKTHLFHIVIR